jgi:hypothetical protein
LEELSDAEVEEALAEVLADADLDSVEIGMQLRSIQIQAKRKMNK